MTTELNAAPDAAAEIDASVPQENPEVANPESGEQPKQEEADPVKALEERLEKERRNFERRMNRKHAQAAQAEERARVLEAQLQSVQPKTEGDEKLDPAKVQELIEQKAERLAQAKEFQGRVDRVLEAGSKNASFTALCNTVADEMPFYDPKGAPTAFLRAVLDADKPHELLAHLGKNPDLLGDLDGLSEGQLSRRLDRIEQAMKAPPKPSKAPAPLSPVKGGGKTGELSADDPDFITKRLQQLRGR